MPPIDARIARRRFARAAATYPGASRLEAEIGARMLERLDYVKISPRRVLEAGCGPGRESAALRRRYPGATLLEVDFAAPMLRRKPGWMERLAARRVFQVCADIARLPLAGGSVELAWSNMALHWAADPQAVLRELGRVLAADGLVMFSTLGPDTLAELRAIAGERVHRFADMHDVGDALVAAGFSAPVMDVERLTLTYGSAAALLQELRASGQTCAHSSQQRGSGLRGRAFRAALERDLEQRRRGERVEVTCEVVYGHAWKGTPKKSVDAVKPVQFHRLPS